MEENTWHRQNKHDGFVRGNGRGRFIGSGKFKGGLLLTRLLNTGATKEETGQTR
jgi:hypothetical protein